MNELTLRSMREAAGQTTKASLSHVLLSDTRDDPFLPTRGSYLRLAQEYAGLGGDAQHVKLEADSLVARSIGGGFVRRALPGQADFRRRSPPGSKPACSIR